MAVNLNERAAQIVATIRSRGPELRVERHVRADGGETFDLGVKAPGGNEAGRWLALACLADLGSVAFVPAADSLPCDAEVQVVTDQPILACLASQYAGWQIAAGKFFAMGSGPMRAVAGKEKLFDDLGYREQSESVVGILETGKLPTDEALALIADGCDLPARNVTLLAARTASLAGTVQVVARSVETALHKLHELGFDLSRVVSGYGRAPLPPVAKDDLAAIGRTNDAILYGGRVTLWVRGDDDSLAEIGAQAPSGASPAYGEPFARIFEQAGHDFYKIDPHLFSPAAIRFHNLDTGRTHQFGAIDPRVLTQSFTS